jgi:mannose-6-phosphate isomerase
MDLPLHFTPFLRPMVWGGRRLQQLGKLLPTPEPYGESWEISDHPVHRSIVDGGPYHGRSLRQLMQTDRGALLGPAAGACTVFPWLVKFLDCSDWLSVQVHPDEASVSELWPGEGSKTEAWFILTAEPGSRIYAGLRPGVAEKQFRAGLATGEVADYLHSFEPRPGDCVFLPAGTVHAAGGGILLAEVQQTSDATFRLFDWNRRDAQGKSRTLHIDQGLASVDWSRSPVQPVHVQDWDGRRPSKTPAPGAQVLVDCPYFRLKFLRAAGPLALGGQERLQAVIVLGGEGRWSTPAGEGCFKTGQTWLLPARSAPTTWYAEGNASLLLCELP